MEGTIIKHDQSIAHHLSLLRTLLQSETKASSGTLASCYMGSIRTSAKQHGMTTIIYTTWKNK